ncbi:hypothetical protein WJX72_004660 [[Myrmecia] bisecta]|uniref:Ubiquitin-related modifier 1 homolog n=1 Tax=[Myrmecia] bisecta TaxID=41462 RepID=A0AAW1Q1D1_9CHLO
MVKVNIELSGGLELLFGNQKTHQIDMPADNGNKQVQLGSLLVWARDNLLTERPELFMKGNTVRPGILVLINDVDWELRWHSA